jgi:hypothetical protein
MNEERGDEDPWHRQEEVRDKLGSKVRENIEKNCIQKTIQQDDWFYSVGP